MNFFSNPTVRAFSVLVGMVIGAGFFGVPYVIAKSGTITGLIYFIGLGFIITLLHLMYGEIVLRTKEKHRLPGFAKKYLGKGWEKFTKISSTLGAYGALAAYVILGGKFSFFLLSPIIGGTEFLYQIIYFVIFGGLLMLNTNPMAEIETLMTGGLIVLIVIIVTFALPHFNITNLSLFNSENIFLPYGVLIFAFFGGAAIPEIKDVLGEKLSKMKKVLVWGSVFCILITALFALVTIRLSGSSVSQDAIWGLAEIMGPWVLIIGSIIGFLAVTTSFLVLGLYVKDQFRYDFKFNHTLSFLLTIIPSFLVMLLFKKDFIIIISLVGAIFAATDSTLLACIWLKAKTLGDRQPEYKLKIGSWLAYIVTILFIIGGVSEILSLLK